MHGRRQRWQPYQGLDANLERCTSAVTGDTARGEAALLMCCVAQQNSPEVILEEKSSLVSDYELTLHNLTLTKWGMEQFHSYGWKKLCASPLAAGYGLIVIEWLSLLVLQVQSLAVKVLGSMTGRPIIRSATDLRKKYVGEEARLKIAIDLAASMDGIIY